MTWSSVSSLKVRHCRPHLLLRETEVVISENLVEDAVSFLHGGGKKQCCADPGS